MLDNDVNCIEYENERERCLSDDNVMFCPKDEFGITYGQQIQKLCKECETLFLQPLSEYARCKAVAAADKNWQNRHLKCVQDNIQADRTVTCPIVQGDLVYYENWNTYTTT